MITPTSFGTFAPEERRPARRPAPLKPGDKIAIVAPATVVKGEYVDGAADFLRGQGFEPVVFPHCLGPASGTFASAEEQRLDDLLTALGDPQYRCVLCARGGYGCVHLIGDVPGALPEADPKWVVGFSDVSALHALMRSKGVMSLHAGMAKHLCETDADHPSVRELLNILRGADEVTYRLTDADGCRVLRGGMATGELRGGNLAVLDALASTPYDLLHIRPGERVILFIEDVGEAIYKVDRMLWRLHLSGDLHRAAGLIFCSFNDYRPDANYPDMEAMIAARMQRFGIDVPVVLRFPAGHEQGRNLPLVEGCQATLSATPGGVTLRQNLNTPPQ